MKRSQTIVKNQKNTVVLEYPFLQLPTPCRIIYVKNVLQCQAACKTVNYIAQQYPYSVWGFDCEWKVTYKNSYSNNGIRPVALIQLCRQDVIILFQISACGMLPCLIDILRNENILFCGVNIIGDIRKLEKDYFTFTNSNADILPVIPNVNNIQGAFDVRHLSKACSIPPGSSLAAMVEQTLHAILPKPNHLRCGDWEVVPLSEDMLHYAALDAYCSWAVYDRIVQQRLEACDIPLHSKDAEVYIYELLQKLLIDISPVHVPLTDADSGPVADLEADIQAYDEVTRRANNSFKEIEHGNKMVRINETDPSPSTVGRECTMQHIDTQHQHQSSTSTSLLQPPPSPPPANVLAFIARLPNKVPSSRANGNVVLFSSKDETYKLWLAGHSVFAISKKKKIKESTVLSYLLKCVAEGYAYTFSMLPVTTQEKLDIICILFAMIADNIGISGGNCSRDDLKLKDIMMLFENLYKKSIDFSKVQFVLYHLDRTLGLEWPQLLR